MGLESASTYTDFAGMAALKARASHDAEGSVDEVARQFESIFINMMLKGMRDASMGDSMFDNDSVKMAREMYDKQLALTLAESGGIGLAEVIKSQLTQQSTQADVIGQTAKSYLSVPVQRAPATSSGRHLSDSIESNESTDMDFSSPREFIDRLMPLAEQAADRLGLDPRALLSQAALETGWGKHLMTDKAGKSSFNLFGIKADKGWSGEQISVSTLEYDHGVARQETARFRAYDSFKDSFDDYVNFVQSNPRYQQALNQVSDAKRYLHELQQAGYATDPEYAEKINKILNGAEMQLQRQVLNNKGEQPIHG